MFESTSVRQVYSTYESLLNKPLTLTGWVRSIRTGAEVSFIDLSDGTFFKGVQIVVPASIALDGISTGASLVARGILIESPAAGQPFELKADEVTLVGASASDYPLQKKRHTREYLRTIAHLRPKTNLFQAVFRVRSLASFALHQFFNERGFVYLHSPILTDMDGEGAGEMFQVTTNGGDKPEEDFFGKKAFLTVTGQLNGEVFAQAFKNIYTFGPTFRAENSNTKRHAAEFWMLEPEIAFADLSVVIDLAYVMLQHTINYVLTHAPEEMAFLNEYVEKGLIDKLKQVAAAGVKTVTYTEAISLLQQSGQTFEYPVNWGDDLQTEHERYLAEQIYQGPVFVTDYPKDIKAFYMRLNEDGKTVAATDLLVPGIGELIGGSQREEREDVLLAKMAAQGLDTEHMSFYVDLRKYGTTPHGGFGLGFERLVMYLTGVDNIRDVLPFPRTVNNLAF